ncbi:hypothetical protein I3843_04G160100 [Carya illinoinensis]|nr:hypothetical protein I3843_04G160100 [Carya illinoinensis]
MIQKTVENNALVYLSQKCKTLNHLKQIHAHLLKSHLPVNPYAIAPLLSIAATSNDASFFSYARSVFEHFRHRNIFMYNTMIRGRAQSHSPVRAILCYFGMLNYGLVPNNYTFPPLIKACTFSVPHSKLIGRLVHAHVVTFGFSDDPFVVSALIEYYSVAQDIGTARLLFDITPKKDVVMWTAMTDGYGKLGDVANARLLFEEMPERNVISWSAIMAAYSRASDFKEVLSLFKKMQETGIKPNESVLVSVVTACAHLGAVTQGLWIHSYAKQHNLESNPILATALVDMYSKCGCVESALLVFNSIPKKDAGAWNAMISGVAMNGDAMKSLDLFSEMTTTGTQPTDTTFVAVLTACTHAKMVDQGLKLFEQMDTIYGLVPKLEHYACVVDLLARAGMLEEAERFIEEKMGGFSRGDANIWGALQSACRIYGNVEIGNRVWKKLIDVGVVDSGTSVLSYNMYREAGWEMDAKKVRKTIADSRLKKKPGCSVIEVSGKVEEFLAGDLCHSQAQEICTTLDSLSKIINLKGWVK